MQYQKPAMVQQQKLKMNPQLFQSVKLLAMPLQELKFTIQEELEKNPALELIEEQKETPLEPLGKQKPAEDYDYFENSSDPGYNQTSPDDDASDAKRKFIEGTISRPESLRDHLMWQLRLYPMPKDEFEIGDLLIHNLNEDGFHIVDPPGLIKNKDSSKPNRVIQLIQSFDPLGTCTKDYRESLTVQARLLGTAPDGVFEVLERYFDLLELKKYSILRKKLRLADEDLDEIIEFIKALNPFPGRQYSTESSKYVLPDLMVKIADGEFVIVLNDEEIPVLGINEFFTDVTKEKSRKKDAILVKYVTTQVRDARWFIHTIHQRNKTLLKIAKAIVEYQRDFFLKGPKHLAPLTLKDIANEVGVHETTVSRIANAKYMQTEWGIFEIKYFFSNSISGTGSSGSRFSKEGVKAVIKELLDSHTSDKPLSDQKIAEMLEHSSITIARRTVAKYRKELDIDSSYNR